MKKMMPTEYRGTFKFICVNCLNSWEKIGSSREDAKSKCPKCKTEMEGRFEMFDPDEDVDAT